MKNKKNHTKRPVSKSNSESHTVSQTARSIGIGIASSFIAAAVLTVLFSFAALCFKDPNKTVPLFAFLALSLASLTGGFISMKLNSSSFLLCGLLTGCGILIFCLFLSFVFKAPHASSGIVTVIAFRASIPIFSLFGSFIAMRKPKPRKRKH